MEWVRGSTDEFDLCRVAASFNKTVNRTPKACRFWFPPLRSGAGYLSVKITPILTNARPVDQCVSMAYTLHP